MVEIKVESAFLINIQSGCSKAGHDINYLSYSGILSTFGDNNSHPLPPNNMLADFGGGGAFGVIGILMALFERSKTGKVKNKSITFMFVIRLTLSKQY